MGRQSPLQPCQILNKLANYWSFDSSNLKIINPHPKNNNYAQGPSHSNATTQPNRECEIILRNLHGITCNFLPRVGSCLFSQPTPQLPSLFVLLDFLIVISSKPHELATCEDYPNYRFSPNPVGINFNTPFYVSHNLTHTHTCSCRLIGGFNQIQLNNTRISMHLI